MWRLKIDEVVKADELSQTWVGAYTAKGNRVYINSTITVNKSMWPTWLRLTSTLDHNKTRKYDNGRLSDERLRDIWMDIHQSWLF